MNSLPLGAKLDYREDVDKLHADVMGKIAVSQEKAEEALARNTKLANEIRDVLAKQEKILAVLDCKPGGGNPVVERLKDKFSGIDDIAKLAREHEMRICDSLRLTPEDGWELAFARLEKPAKEGRTMGEISNILLHKEKFEKSPDTDYAKPEKFVEDVEGFPGSSTEENSSKRKSGKTPGSTKRAVKRMKI
jgi:hypothetical protein